MTVRTLVVLLALVAGCTSVGGTGRDGLAAGSEEALPEEALPEEALPEVDLASMLEPFDGCDVLTGELRSRAGDRVGPYGLGSLGRGFGAEAGEPTALVDDAAASAVGRAAPAAAAEAAASDADGGFSTTNVQEAGVDEPDLAKTDGEWLYTVVDGALRVVDVRDGTPLVVATLALDGGFARDLLLDGDRLVVLGEGAVRPLEPPRQFRDGDLQVIPPWTPQTRLWLVDVADPHRPTVLSDMTVDGSLLSSRTSDGTVHVVVRSLLAPPNLVHPIDPRPVWQQRAAAVNRRVIEESDARQWLPRVRTDDGAAPLVDCASVYRPRGVEGLGLVTVLSLDPREPKLRADRTEAVLGAADTVYASNDSLYVTTSRWPIVRPVAPPRPETAPSTVPVEPPQVTTEIHRFAIDSRGATYRSSGSVPGRVLNQWALSEHDGHLRIATTTGELGAGSSSAVHVLREDGGRLVEVGRVGDLGRGERIFAVRYAGDVGFVVTFRQIDPLYTLDLSDPTAPTVLGELKIPGYSAYLHPIGDDHLLGVGQDADAQGRPLGVQLSLFDLSDLRAPRRVAQITLGSGTTTAVEHDHRAFLYWADAATAVLPIDDWNASGQGAGVFTVTPDILRQRGFVRHPAGGTSTSNDAALYDGGSVQRAFVIGDRLVTLSATGVLVSDLDTLEPLGVTGF